ncbi:hypothetical protein SELMODRAFT_96692 [Selaginella moellendorffii]|uniref:non-specific serine/threonine protein kinase n=1 Tax=Selaginella moellendorffii TaxID=88036 RepID=D8RM81_SELML|nr:receptor-like protein kinase HSL1 [Selaginella moellendorffii]EFJ26843.1 hypothetical protein SELMODRAFT_96692 [Selaginella moellendorffii]|eukprot:XP_002971926.1 receptor-like protein kinase HSL1 [Selaginella moellendorffii]
MLSTAPIHEHAAKLLLLLVVAFVLPQVNNATTAATIAVASEPQILLSFKASISDPLGHLGDWQLPQNGSSSFEHCSWSGVSCDSISRSVTGLDLQSRNLSGALDSTVCNLPGLASLSLSDNNFTQLFPVGLYSCKNLVFLDLSYNNFFGPLPDNISSLRSLEYLDLEYNAFTGPMPDDIGNLSQLQYFNVWECLLTTISPALGKLSRLTNLTLSYNPFTTPLPPELRHLKSLQSLKCGGCQLTGSIPDWLGELKNLDFLELTWNSLSGIIPSSIMHLPKLTSLELYSNKLTGPIPSEVEFLVSLTDLDLNSNFLNGSIPDTLAKIPNLGLLHLWNNSLTGEIPQGLARLSKLYDLSLFGNQLTGIIPAELGLHTSLEIFDVSTNLLTGAVPSGLCTGGRLQKLIFFNNSLSGGIPSAYEDCESLVRVRMYHNKLSGALPSGMWGLPRMTILEIYDNNFQGSVPPQLGHATNLETLRIHNNKLTGTIPTDIDKLQVLDEFTAYGNKLSGTIPDNLCKCSSMSKLLLGSNQLEGEIPSNIGDLSSLAILDLSNNHLSGSIPPSIVKMVSLNSLDLSRNNFSGDIPPVLTRMRLKDFLLFNVSYNDFSGVLPQALDVPMFNSSFIGNPKLCVGAPWSLRRSMDCQADSSRLRKQPGMMAWIAGSVLASAAAASALCSYYLYKRCHQPSKTRDGCKEEPWTMTPFQKLTFTMDDVLRSLDEDNVIGSGGAGKVYKATLKSNNECSHLAIKKLWSCDKAEIRNDYGFKTEVNILGRIRHFNIVRLLCCCSNGETNLLVYEYVPNGSLGDALHHPSTKISGVLDWPARYRIALGAAQGLSYLHHDCVPAILHRDIKSNNILLSDEYDALLADFGIAKLVGSNSSTEFSMSVLAGSHGYIAPEYAHRMKVNEKSDVYSFGVVLLELVTGKKPVGSPEFGDNGVDIVTWACNSIQSKQGVDAVIDPRLSPAICRQRDLLLVLKIALRCTNALASSRPSMRDVVQMLLDAHPGSNPPKK